MHGRKPLEGAGGSTKINKFDLIKEFSQHGTKILKNTLIRFFPRDSLKIDSKKQPWEYSNSWEQTGFQELFVPVEAVMLLLVPEHEHLTVTPSWDPSMSWVGRDPRGSASPAQESC